MAKYPVAYRRAARAAGRGFQPIPRAANDNRMGVVRLPGSSGRARQYQTLSPRAQAGLEALAQGPGALWTAAEQYHWALQGIRAQNWVQYWQQCKNCNHGYTLNAYAAGDCAWGCFTPWQSMNWNDLTVGTTTGMQTMYIGTGRVSFGVEQIHIEEVWTRKATAPASPTQIPRARPDLGTTEKNPNPKPVQDPFQYPQEWPWPLPQVGPVVRPSTQPEFAPRPHPATQPSRSPATQPIEVPFPVFQPGPGVEPWTTPEVGVAVQPGTSTDPSVQPYVQPRPWPRVQPKPQPPKPREREGKLNVRAAAGAAWVGAQAAFAAVEFFGEANKTLPEGMRAPANARPHVKAQAVYEHWQHVDVALAFETWANNAIEDAFFGVAVGKSGKAANQASGNATGGGRAMSGHWKEADVTPDLPTVEIDPETGEAWVDFGRYGKKNVNPAKW